MSSQGHGGRDSIHQPSGAFSLPLGECVPSSKEKGVYGQLARQWCKLELPLQVLQSNSGFYIGTADGDAPVSRESVEYFQTHATAQQALQDGTWTQDVIL